MYVKVWLSQSCTSEILIKELQESFQVKGFYIHGGRDFCLKFSRILFELSQKMVQENEIGLKLLPLTQYQKISARPSQK